MPRDGASSPGRVAVVGAGIIGTSIAFGLQRRGHAVTLIDPGEPGRGASSGNMASIAVTEFLPSSRPSTWRQMPRWLLDPAGPIRIRPSYLPTLLPWFARFVMAGRPSRVRQVETAGAALCARVYDDLLPMLEAAGLVGMLGREGCLSLYADDAEFQADREHLDAIARHGFPTETLGGNALRDLEPAIGPAIRHAVLFPQNRTISDPFVLVERLMERFRSAGGVLETGRVTGFERADGEITALRLEGGRSIAVRCAVLSAGAYTGRLSKLLGEPMPLETERGYHTQIMSPGIGLKHSVIWPARAFMVSPTAGGIRVGGTVEMAGLHAAPDYRRARALVSRAREALPDLRCEGATEWMGHRPALPDTIPIIGPSARTRGIYYATGHGHLGLTLSATTARIIADLVSGRTPPVDIQPYRIDRF